MARAPELALVPPPVASATLTADPSLEGTSGLLPPCRQHGERGLPRPGSGHHQPRPTRKARAPSQLAEASTQPIAGHGRAHLVTDGEGHARWAGRPTAVTDRGARHRIGQPGHGEQPASGPRGVPKRPKRLPVGDAPDQADSRVRPLARRALMIARPARVDMRCRNPCRLARRRLFGWNGRFTHRLRCPRARRDAPAPARVPTAMVPRATAQTTTPWPARQTPWPPPPAASRERPEPSKRHRPRSPGPCAASEAWCYGARTAHPTAHRRRLSTSPGTSAIG